uniref:Myb/SANT-like domain-containing protein n=1 Tax=Nelumbo nucifera TaxID=4432 RepID=A0A822XWU2_NELNU|nr:TPA_asm: hypothetical protein HUJ06_024698 [Nelumbo nucifera]
MWKCDGGFKNGYMIKLQDMIRSGIPNCNLQANPHIDSRLKWLKQKYFAISQMLKESCCKWDDTRKMIQCEKDWYERWCKAHFSSVADKVGLLIEDIGIHFKAIASAMTHEDEREQQVTDRSNNIVGELMKIEGLTNGDIFRAANILSTEAPKLNVLSQPPQVMKRQYVL